MKGSLKRYFIKRGRMLMKRRILHLIDKKVCEINESTTFTVLDYGKILVLQDLVQEIENMRL